MVKKLQQKVTTIVNALLSFYGAPHSLKAQLVITKEGEFGTKDLTSCGKNLVLEYCPNKLQQEFDAIGLKIDFDKFLTYAFAESLSMGAQKALMIKTCNRACKDCRGSSKAQQFKLANYVLTYYAADYVTSKLWGESKLGLKILKKINNAPAKKITKALRAIYSCSQHQRLIKKLSQEGNLTFDEILVKVSSKGLNKVTRPRLL